MKSESTEQKRRAREWRALPEMFPKRHARGGDDEIQFNLLSVE
jgi:hypothetical protein